MRENSPAPRWAVAGGGGNNAASSDCIQSGPGRGGQRTKLPPNCCDVQLFDAKHKQNMHPMEG